MRKFLKIAASIVAGLYLAAFAGLALFQRSFEYSPTRAYASPQSAGLANVEEFTVQSADGESISGWYAPPREGRPLLLYFHGNAGPLADRKKRFQLFLDAGYGLLAPNWRGFSRSTGTPTEEGLTLDAEAAWREALRRGHAPERIVIIGESLGTGLATKIAAAHPAAALLLDSPFLSALDLAERRYPLFPVRWLMQDPYRSDLEIGKAHLPLLILHAADDPVIPLESAQALFRLANEPKRLIVSPARRHLVLAEDEIFPQARAFIDASAAATK